MKMKTKSGLNLRRTAGIATDNVLRVLPAGVTVEVLSRQGDWALISTSTGERGYVSYKYLKPTGWRVARALTQLRRQIDTRWPARKKGYDGTIGDEAHQERKSDHNPMSAPEGASEPTPVVTAMDITHDPVNGVDCARIAEALRKRKDKRIKYVIWNHRMFSAIDTANGKAWEWRKYSGINPHDHHMHVSVSAVPLLYDDEAPWVLEA